MPNARLSYKFQRLREAIRDSISSGELNGKLPGERELARRFGVNAKTISKALTDLTSEGLLVRHVGRGTFVAGSKQAASSNGRQYVWLCSEDTDPAIRDAMFAIAQNRLATSGHVLSMLTVETDDSGELPDRCLPVSRLKGIGGIIVFRSSPSTALLADFLRRHVPFVLCNTRGSTIKCNSVTADYARGCFELSEYLVMCGHDKIALVVDESEELVCEQAARGYQSAMNRYGHQPFAVIRTTPDDVEGIVRNPANVTAIVCLGDALAIKLGKSLNSEDVPQQLSIVAMSTPGQIGLQQHAITSYDVYPDHILDWTIQVLFDAAPGMPAREVIVPGVFNRRGSVRGQAASTQTQIKAAAL